MFHDQHVFTHGMYLPFCFLCPAQSLLWVYPVWVHSQCAVWRFSNIFFQLFRCRNLALNRVFSYFLVAGMFFYTWRVSGCPHVCTPPHMSCTPAIHLYAPRSVYTPICTHTPVHLYVLGGFACCGGCKGLPVVLGHFPYTTPVWGVSPSFTPPHSVVGSCALVCSGISVCYVGIFPSVEGFGGVPGVFPHQLGGLGSIST